MAALKLRTGLSVVVLVIANIVISVKSDDVRPQQLTANFMSNMPARHLLRGSSENIPENLTSNLEEPHALEDITSIDKDINLDRGDDDKHKNVNKSEKATESEDNSEMSSDILQKMKYQTTATSQATTEAISTDPSNPVSIEEDETKESPNVYTHHAESKGSVDQELEDKAQAMNNLDEVHTTSPDEPIVETSTVSDTDRETMYMTDRAAIVYKHENILSDDNYSTDDIVNRSNNIESIAPANSASAIEKLETTTAVVTKRSDEAESTFRMADILEELEINAQRSPKTDQTASGPAIDRREPEPAGPKPRPPATAATAKATRSSTLKGWLEDVWVRAPAAILAPLRPTALTRALAVWQDLPGLNLTDIIVVGYDEGGVNWRSRHNLQSSSGGSRAVAEALSKLLLKYQGVHGNEAAGDGTMKALATASKLVPYDSALFVITDRGAADGHRLPLALRPLVEKRLKVYTIWTDPKYPSKESNLALADLRQISQHTEGDVLPYSLQVMETDSVSNLASEFNQWELKPARTARLNFDNSDKFETLLVRRGGGDAGSHGVPVENGVTSLRVFIEGAVEHAVLYPPNGPQIDLLNETSVTAFSPTSRTDSLAPRDVFLSFPGATPTDMLAVLPAAKTKSEEPTAPTVGLWHLSVRCDTCDYRLTVSAQARIGLDAVLSGQGTKKEMIHLRVRGPVATVRETTVVDEYGTEIGKLHFSYEPAAGEGSDDRGLNRESNAELVTDIPMPPIKTNKIYVKVVGRDVHGESFVRLAGPLREQRSELRMSRSAAVRFPDTVNDLEMAEETNQRITNGAGIVPYQRNDSVVLPNSRATSQVTNQRGAWLTAVQIGLGTTLYGAPGDSLQLHFEVTNYREQTVSFKFEAIGELRFLRGINPRAQIIGPGQTANVIVYVGITASAQPGARDLITFTAYGFEQVSMSVYIYVVNPNTVASDVWSPTLNHNFQGTCLGRTGSDCAQHTWSATIVARDALGGLLRLTSSPVGLMYESNFISGTREEVTATYRATCCNPRVMVTAIDVYGNANSYVVDISNYFTEAAIAAVVLGVFFLIALIAFIIFLIYWCVKRRKESRELPSYTTSRRELS